MQKNVNVVFSKKFITDFRNFLIDFYKYETFMDFVIVPFLTKKTLMYLPVISYSDRKHNEIQDLLELAKDNDYQIRTLNFDYKNFIKNDPVTMRLVLEDKTIDDILASFSTNTRKAIKRGNKQGFKFCSGVKEKEIENFYKLYSNVLHSHGTPHFGKDFFYELKNALGDRVLFNCFYDGDEIVASNCVLYDDEFSIVQWLGVNPKYKNKGAGYLIYMAEIQNSIERNKRIIDFGRSGYETGTYEFKRRFRASPIKIDIFQPKIEDLYSKYELASKIWRKLPKSVVEFIGPKLTKYLKDL